MQKIINSKEKVVDESFEGMLLAYEKYWKRHPEVKGIISRTRRKDKVALVIGGGSGHEPIYSCFVGPGLADAAVCGNIFASPDPNSVYQTAKAVDAGKGILFIYGNYAGDNLNFDMGEEFLNDDGIPTAHVRGMDDVVSQPKENYEQRRGIAGALYMVKIAGAVCDAGLSLEEAKRVMEKTRDSIRSVGVATSGAQLPGADKPIFELPEGMIEYGMGVHGERGVKRVPMEPADTLVDNMMQSIFDDGDYKEGDEVAVYINAFGGTSITEMSIAYRRVRQILAEKGIKVYDTDINDYFRTQEMGGFSITLLTLDDELKKYYDMPCWCPYFGKGAVNAAAPEGEEEDEIVPEPEFDDSDVEDAPVVRSKEGTLESLNVADTKNMLLTVANKIISNVDYLTEIDSQTGDGDHGFGMGGGMQKAKKKLLNMADTDNAFELFEAAGKAMLLSMGGASGVIFGSMFMSGGQGFDPKGELTAEDLCQIEEKALKTIQERGGASVGDKTMVDALAPAVDALRANVDKGLLDMLKEAEAAAKQGMENTKNCIAKYGRAKSLGERALGYQDAGATSVALIFEAMREFVEG